MRRLLIRPGAIGDCLLALPALEGLRAAYTEVWISSPLVPLIRFAQRVRSISSTGIDLVGVGDIPVPKRLTEELASFDSIVSWYGTQRAPFRAALQASGVSCEFLGALPPLDYPGHAATFFCQQAGVADGMPRIETADTVARDTVVIHPFSGGKQKNWPLARYRTLAAGLGCPVEWTAGPEEELPGAQRFEDLQELARWIRGARLYIGNDSGITHLAAASGVPTLALFGPTDPAKWAPRGPNVVVLRHQPLEELGVEQVRQTVSRLLG